jgi:dienelactone hydrolase
MTAARRWLLWLALLLPATLAAAPAEEILPLSLASGRTLEVRLLRPEAARQKLPAIILLGGYRRGAGALDLVTAGQPVLLAGFDYPVELPRKLRVSEIPRLVPQMRRGIAETREGLALLHERLRRRPDVDPRRITLVGVSAGAPFATLAAADAGFPAVILVHGFADLPGVIEHQFARRWEPKYGRPGRWGAWLSSRLLHGLLALPSIEDAAASLKPGQRVLMIRAERDDFVPAGSSLALEHALRRSQAQLDLVVQPGGHVRGSAQEELRPVLEASLEWMRRKKLI